MIQGKLIGQYLGADYVDSYSAIVAGGQGLTVDVLFERIFIQLPPFVQKLLKLRDTLVKPLKLKTGATFQDRIIERDEEEIIIGAQDKHLSFWVSVYCSMPNNSPQTAVVTTVVKYHNFMGKCYFAAIKPFHKLIVRYLFRKATTYYPHRRVTERATL